jgi:hypothetical protein
MEARQFPVLPLLISAKFNCLKVDRQLLAMFSGILFSFVVMISLAVTAGIWYL